MYIVESEKDARRLYEVLDRVDKEALRAAWKQFKEVYAGVPKEALGSFSELVELPSGQTVTLKGSGEARDVATNKPVAHLGKSGEEAKRVDSLLHAFWPDE